jgi:hypothetical protein
MKITVVGAVVFVAAVIVVLLVIRGMTQERDVGPNQDGSPEHPPF